MRRLTIFVLAVAVIYSGYWFVGARAVTNTAEAQITQLRNDGWTVDYDDLVVRGFPSRFDTGLTDIQVGSPNGDLGYAAPFLQAFALSYQPNKAIMAFPNTQDLTFGTETFNIASTGLRASVGVGANTALSLDAVTAEAQDVVVSNPQMGALSFTDLLIALRESSPLPNSYDVYFNAQNVALPDQISALLNSGGTLPAALEIVNADATIVLDKPLNRHTLPAWEVDPGKLRGMTVRDLNIRWGDLAITGDGSITVDETGTPDGTMTLRATDWQRMLDIALEAGLLPVDMQFLARSMGQTLSQGAPDLTLPLTFLNGNMSIGPIPLGPAPKVF